MGFISETVAPAYDIDIIKREAEELFSLYREDWCFFAADVFGVLPK